MKVSSGKNKGRKLQQWVRDRLIEVLDLPKEDVQSVPGGVSGPDIWLSDRAKMSFPFAIECKNQERLNLWKAWKQCTGNSDDICLPMLIIKKNYERPLVVMYFDDFINEWVENPND